VTAQGLSGPDPSSFGHVMRSASRYAPVATAIGTGAQNLYEARYVPIWVPNTITIAEIACETTVVGAGTSTVRLAVASDINGRPGTHLYCSAELPTITVGKISAAPGLTLAPGRYYLAACSQGTGAMATYRTHSGIAEMYEQPTVPTFLRAGYSTYGQTLALTGAVPAASMDAANAIRVEVLTA